MYISLRVKYELFLSDFNENRFSKKIFKYDYHENLSVGAKLLNEDGRTDRHDGANNRFSLFRESAQKPAF